MAKTQMTLDLEKAIWRATKKQGTFGCFEVTIGWFGRERVDYMTYDTKGVWRCYEIKVSKADFFSKAHNTFIGHYNYYVMPQDLYEKVKDSIPHDIGVYIGGHLEKRPRRRTLTSDEQTLKDSMIRSLCRDVDKQVRSGDPTIVEIYRREINQLKRDLKNVWSRYWDELAELQARRRADRAGLSFDREAWEQEKED